MDRMRDCLQAKHSVHELSERTLARRTKVRNANGRCDFESAEHGEIVYHVMESDERDCLQAKHSVHELSERT